MLTRKLGLIPTIAILGITVYVVLRVILFAVGCLTIAQRAIGI